MSGVVHQLGIGVPEEVCPLRYSHCERWFELHPDETTNPLKIQVQLRQVKCCSRTKLHVPDAKGPLHCLRHGQVK